MFTRLLRNFKLSGLRRPLRSIGLKIGLIFVVFVAATGYASYRIASNVLKDKVTEAYTETAVQASQKLDSLYRTFEQIVSQMMVDDEIQSTVTGLLAGDLDDYDASQMATRLDTRLESYMFSNPAITSIELLRREGNYIPTTSGLLTNKSYAEEAWFRAINDKEGEFVWIDGNLPDNRNANPTITLGRVLRGQGMADGYGVVLIDVGVDAIAKQLKDVKLDSGDIRVVSPSGKAVYRQASLPSGQAKNESLARMSDTSG
ncbi:cache domain-containing protein [Cohnella yongneupensis]|uniref:Cache domain-containing protein n=1 Tax=Cohnella yongneupensis TaxID=425006 RepID=A0ABW0QX46_9BACL